MNFGRVFEYNVRNIFLEKSHTRCCGEEKAEKSKIEHNSESTVWNVVKFVFIVSPSRGLQKYFKTKVLTTYIYHI